LSNTYFDRDEAMSMNRRSRNITEGVARAPNRSMYYALGYEKGDFGKPMIGVANGHSTITPCNSGLQKLADAAVAGIEEAGGNAQIFGTPPSATAWRWAPRA
jgi:dihydroxy-acid dehydratase